MCVCGGGGYNTEKLSLSSIGKMNLNASQRTERVGAVHGKICPHIFSAEADPCVHTHTHTHIHGKPDGPVCCEWVGGWAGG